LIESMIFRWFSGGSGILEGESEKVKSNIYIVKQLNSTFKFDTSGFGVTELINFSVTSIHVDLCTVNTCMDVHANQICKLLVRHYWERPMKNVHWLTFRFLDIFISVHNNLIKVSLDRSNNLVSWVLWTDGVL